MSFCSWVNSNEQKGIIQVVLYFAEKVCKFYIKEITRFYTVVTVLFVNNFDLFRG